MEAVMPRGNESAEDGPGYFAEDASLASIGEPQRVPKDARVDYPTPSAEELDERDKKFGPRKPMGPTSGALSESVPENLSDTSTSSEKRKPRSSRRKGGK
jgi:hypothetical protein